MEKIIENLKSWSINFIVNKDLIHKKILKIEEKAGESVFHVTFKEKEQHFYVTKELTHELLEKHNNDEFYAIFSFNTQKNFDFILENWNSVCQHKRLTIYLINPFLSHDNKWILNPYSHSLIADKASFKKGMLSMFEAVPPVLEKDLKINASF